MPISRRSFLTHTTLGAGMLAASSGMVVAQATAPPIAGFEAKDTITDIDTSTVWQQKFDRKIRMGLVGYGLCQFGLQFSFQTHPNVELVAVSDLIPERCAAMARAAKCEKTYPSLEEMVKDDSIEAIFLGTDAPSHAQQCLEVMKHGKHVAVAVPATWGNLEEADMLYEMVKETGLNYMMFETSMYHDALYAMRQIYNAGGFGKLIYTEGEYFHIMPKPLESFKGWRIGLPPQYYPTHGNAYYGSFTEVSCMGTRSSFPHFQPENNIYKNPFGSEIALFRTSEGGTARMAVGWDTVIGGETGRVSGEKGIYWRGSFVPDVHSFSRAEVAELNNLVNGLNLRKPPLPPTVSPGHHGGSHGHLGHEFVMSILENRQPLIDIAMSLNMTVSGIVAHQSAMKGGELMKIPQYNRK
jgi:hypothetical protein